MRSVPVFTTLLLSAIAGLLLAGGCGGGGAKPSAAPDEQKLRGLITAVRESAETAAQFKPLFVDGAVPADAERQRFYKYTYEIKPPANVSGDDATVTVARAECCRFGDRREPVDRRPQRQRMEAQDRTPARRRK